MVEIETDYAEVEQQADDNKRGKSAADDNKQRVCPECGAAFMPRNGQQVCCSDKCKAARKKRLDDDRYQFRDQKSEIAFREERRKKARRRAAFFAARDAGGAAQEGSSPRGVLRRPRRRLRARRASDAEDRDPQRRARRDAWAVLHRAPLQPAGRCTPQELLLRITCSLRSLRLCVR